MWLLINTDHLESMIFYITNFGPETCKVLKFLGGCTPDTCFIPYYSCCCQTFSAGHCKALIIIIIIIILWSWCTPLDPPLLFATTEPHIAQSIVKKYIVTVAKQPFCKRLQVSTLLHKNIKFNILWCQCKHLY